MVPGAIGHVIWEDLAKVYSKQGYGVAYPDSGGRAAIGTTPEVGIYGHSTGNSGHDIGARVATDWPMAYGDRVDYPLQLGEWYAQEFHVSTPILEWGGKVWYARFEENMRVGANGGEYIIPRQEKLLFIPAITLLAQQLLPHKRQAVRSPPQRTSTLPADSATGPAENCILDSFESHRTTHVSPRQFPVF